MKASTTDPVANNLLDFIAIRESDGNYDAYIGHISPPVGTLTNLTIAEVYAFQHNLLVAGEPSSAVGRYQFVHNTLAALVIQAGFNLTSKFTPAAQDQLAMLLLNQRGYSGWRLGRITNSAFAHNLSCEWASLPDPQNRGKSHYDGDGVNHAGQTLAAVYAAFAAAQGAQHV